MAIVIPSGSRKPRTRMPRNIPPPQALRRPPTVRAPTARPAAASRPSPIPQAPAPITPPTPAQMAPITLPGGTADRATAREQYGGSVATVNRNLRNLAQQYGGVGSVSQFAYNPGDDPRGFGTTSSSNLAIDQNDPNSILSVIGRNLGQNLKFVGDTAGNRNTYFSGLRLSDEDQQRTEANNARLKAAQDYENARLELVDQLTGGAGAQSALRGIIRGSNASDDAATAAAIAQAQAQAPPPEAPAAAPQPPPFDYAAQPRIIPRKPKYAGLGWWGL